MYLHESKKITSNLWFSYKSRCALVLAFSLTTLTLYYFHTNLVPFECKNPKLQGISSVLRQEYTEDFKPPNSVGCHLNFLIVKVGGERRVRHISVFNREHWQNFWIFWERHKNLYDLWKNFVSFEVMRISNHYML